MGQRSGYNKAHDIAEFEKSSPGGALSLTGKGDHRRWWMRWKSYDPLLTEI